MKNIIRFRPLLLLLAILLVGCASTGKRSTRSHDTVSAASYLQLAANAQGAQKQNYLLQAANRLLQDRQTSRAQAILSQIPNQGLPPNLATKKQLLQANIELIQHRFDRALTLLVNIENNQQQLNPSDRLALHQLLAFAYQKSGNVLASLDQYVQSAALTNDKYQRQQNLNDTWRSLQNANPDALSNALSQTDNKIMRGWLMMAIITKRATDNSQELAQQLAYWKQQFPRHPAEELLPSNFQYAKLISAPPKHIALLLPLQGSLASAATAIRNGFLAAYYSAKQRSTSVPKVTVINTASKDITNIYSNAIQNGADFVVGPLTKNNLAQLVKLTRLSVPTLALNTLSNNQSSSNLYQFGLSPIDEARQIANKAWEDHHSRAIVIAPNNDWGRRIANTFMKKWQELGGQIVGQMYYSKQQSLAKEMRQLLHIDKSESVAKNLKKVLNEKIRFIARRRKDIDAVFLVARPTVARQLRPLLRFYYAGNLPVYATSQVYSGAPNPHTDHDLNGIIFCDMPWVITPGKMQPNYLDTIQNRVKTLWPKSYQRHPKLYALGVDAFDTIANLNKLAMLPQFGINGATGTLYLDKRHHLYRKLSWAQMSNGTPRPTR